MLQQKPSISFSHQKKKQKRTSYLSSISSFLSEKVVETSLPESLPTPVIRLPKKKTAKTQRGKTIKVMIRVWLPGTGSLTVAGSTGMMHQKVRELLGDKRKALINYIYLEP